MSRAVAAGIAAGAILDAALGDPKRWHPVAGFGRAALALERVTYRDSRTRGVVHVAVLVGAPTAAALVAQRYAARHPLGLFALTTATVWAALGGRSLGLAARGLQSSIEAGDVDGARTLLPTLCAREPSRLDSTELATATVESVAENTSDAVTAPLVWAGIAGPAGVVAYRAVNTLDAMIGYKSTRYRNFGYAAAKLDDAANWLPSRATSLLAGALAPQVGGSSEVALRTWRSDGGNHPSPNAGRVEAAFAGALGVKLGGSTNRYGDHADPRPAMGTGPRPGARDIGRAVRLSVLIGVASAAAVALTRWRCRR